MVKKILTAVKEVTGEIAAILVIAIVTEAQNYL